MAKLPKCKRTDLALQQVLAHGGDVDAGIVLPISGDDNNMMGASRRTACYACGF